MTDVHINNVIQTAMKFDDWRDDFIVEVDKRITSVMALDDWKDQFMKEVSQKISSIDVTNQQQIVSLTKELINMKTTSCKYSQIFYFWPGIFYKPCGSFLGIFDPTPSHM